MTSRSLKGWLGRDKGTPSRTRPANQQCNVLFEKLPVWDVCLKFTSINKQNYELDGGMMASINSKGSKDMSYINDDMKV